MRYPPNDEYDQDELKALNAEDWMIKVLDVNPGYNSWGPYEDYMSDEGGQ